jgi:hypothetical protein
MGKWRLKMKFRQYSICAGVKARETHLTALLFEELRPEDEGPVIKLLADDLRARLAIADSLTNLKDRRCFDELILRLI